MAELPDRVFRMTMRRSSLVDRFGISAHELRGPLWHRPMYGRYRFAADGSGSSPILRIDSALSVRPPDGAIAGWAAAFSLGARDLDGVRWTGGDEPVLFAVPTGRRVRRDGIATIRAPMPDGDVTTIAGVPVTSAKRTCFDLMRLAASLEDAVVAVDAMLRARVVGLEEMREYVAGRAGWNGVPKARRALELADGRAASCPESRLRVVWMLDAGLPRPEVNVPVCGPSGHLAGITDLLDTKVGLAGEYDGSQHRELGHHTADNAREERLEALGLVVVRATSIDLTSGRQALVRRLRDGYSRARSSPRSKRWLIRQ